MLHILAQDGRCAAFVPVSIRHLVQRMATKGVFGDLLNVRLLLRVLCGPLGLWVFVTFLGYSWVPFTT